LSDLREWEPRFILAARVLIVDDHFLVRRGLRTLLEGYPDWEVCGEASGGLEAIQKSLELQPDLVIMDISMHGIGGLQATRQIRENLPQTEVLILTMHESRELVRAAREAGALGFVIKSQPSSRLLEALRAVTLHEPCFPAASG
jgi:two-component system response regulator NreC